MLRGIRQRNRSRVLHALPADPQVLADTLLSLIIDIKWDGFHWIDQDENIVQPSNWCPNNPSGVSTQDNCYTLDAYTLF